MSSGTIDLSPARWARVEALFDEAADMPRAARIEFLQHACADDPELRAYIGSLLDTDMAEDTLVEDSIRGVLAAAQELAEGTGEAGQRIGAWRIVRTLGSGGMGVVYLASRADLQFSQQVAIKVVRQRLVDPDVEARLKAERQILANLDHPNIARLFDGGTMADGTPYLVMEYIDGVPIDEYCDRRRLTVRQRLELFRTVCAAIQHAHQNLVVHRDIKSSNILVTEAGIPKLLDFGIARLLDNDGASESGLTRVGAIVMTPENAAPEQVLNGTITTAVDTYALGVLLYRLLTGCAPYHVSMSNPGDIARTICEAEPRLPSVAVLRADATAAGGEGVPGTSRALAAARSTTPQRLARRLRGDLDNIVMYALRKEPRRRYRTVNEFSEDIRRHLDRHPVLARPDTWTYRTSRFLGRHAAGVATSAAMLALLVAFAVMMVVQNRRVVEERDTAMQIAGFLEDIFMEPDPGNARGASVSAREILEKGASRIASQLDDRPVVQATLMSTIGRVYFNLGEFDPSIEMLEEALRIRSDQFGERHPEVAAAKNELAASLTRKAQYDRAQALLDDALRLNSDLFGEQSEKVAKTHYNLAELHHAAGDAAAAERHARASVATLEALEGQHASALAESKNMLARVLQLQNELEEADRLLREALALVRAELGGDHPLIAYYSQNLAVLLQDRGKLDEAEAMYEEAIGITRKVLGEEHSLLGGSLVMLGRLLHSRDEYDKAEIAFRDALRVHRKARGETHPFVGYDLVSLGMLLHDMGRLEDAEQRIREGIAIYEASLSRDHQYVASALTALGAVMNDAGRADEAKPLLERALEIRRKDYDRDHPLLASTQSVLGHSLAATGDYASAETLLRDSLEAFEAEENPDPRSIERVRGWLGDVYRAQGRPEKAAALARQRD